MSIYVELICNIQTQVGMVEADSLIIRKNLRFPNNSGPGNCQVNASQISLTFLLKQEKWNFL